MTIDNVTIAGDNNDNCIAGVDEMCSFQIRICDIQNLRSQNERQYITNNSYYKNELVTK